MSEQPQKELIEHRRKLDVFVGEWAAQCRMWQRPGQPPFEYSGMMKSTWQLEHAYLRQEFESELFGGKFLGLGYWGYNAHAARYEGVWMDTASSIMQTETGSADESGKVFSMAGEMPGPNGTTIAKRSVFTVRNPDEVLFEMYFTFSGSPEYKAMEVVYRRKAG